MKKTVSGALAGIIAAAVLASPALAGPTVTVRVEGQSATLLERTRVTLPDAPPPVTGCGAATVGAAIEQATHGNWDRQAFTQTILGESHTFAANDYWAEWVDAGSGYRAGGGICNDVMKDGDEALMLVDVSGAGGAPTNLPLDLEGVPTAVQTGSTVTVTVVQYVSADLAPGSGTRTPVSGATVAGGGVSATTGADGRASLTFPQAGSLVLKASRAGSVVSAGEPLTVSDVAPPPALPGPGTRRADDKTAPVAQLSGLRNGMVFRHGRGPRELKGTVTPDPSGLSAVRLSILRKAGKRCWTFDGSSERFTRHRCGGWRYFKVGDRNAWSFLLPQRLGPGRYTIRVRATDTSANHSESQVVIRVK